MSEEKNQMYFATDPTAKHDQHVVDYHVDNIDLKFTDDALVEISEMAEVENETSENIGARRLHSIIEKVLEDKSFNATGDHPMLEVKIDKAYVQNAFGEKRKKYDLKKYVL